MSNKNIYDSDYVKPHKKSSPSLSARSDTVDDDYDYTNSTTHNYSWKGFEQPTFVGKYAGIRQLMDYSYHKHYNPKRQHLHDKLIDESLCGVDLSTGCEKLEENWLVFTAGTMGVGKGYVLQWLEQEGLFPLSSYVLVDPDMFRERLPESVEYNRRNPQTAGLFTQREVGYISEVLTLIGLRAGKNVLVDGSLRDAKWYIQYVQNLKNEFPDINVGIIHVTASLETLLHRAQTRAELTGRHVPKEIIHETFEQVPRSVVALAPYADVIITFENDIKYQRDRCDDYQCIDEPLCLNIIYPKLEDGKASQQSESNDGNTSSLNGRHTHESIFTPSSSVPHLSSYASEPNLTLESISLLNLNSHPPDGINNTNSNNGVRNAITASRVVRELLKTDSESILASDSTMNGERSSLHTIKPFLVSDERLSMSNPSVQSITTLSNSAQPYFEESIPKMNRESISMSMVDLPSYHTQHLNEDFLKNKPSTDQLSQYLVELDVPSSEAPPSTPVIVQDTSLFTSPPPVVCPDECYASTSVVTHHPTEETKQQDTTPLAAGIAASTQTPHPLIEDPKSSSKPPPLSESTKLPSLVPRLPISGVSAKIRSDSLTSPTSATSTGSTSARIAYHYLHSPARKSRNHNVKDSFLKKLFRNKNHVGDHNNDWWRDEFRQLFEVNCLIPDFASFSNSRKAKSKDDLSNFIGICDGI